MFSFSTIFWVILLAFVIRYILRLNPKTNPSLVVSKKNILTSEKNYKWLRNSSFLILPVFLIAIAVNAPLIIAVLLPFVFHLPIIKRLKTDNLFVFRHTQQTLALLLLRAITTMLIFSIYPYGSGFWVFIVVNGGLWLFGTNWEVKQVKNNDCWLMRRRGEEIILATETSDLPIDTPARMDTEVEKQITSIDKKTKNTRVKQSLQTFRTGTPDERKQALLILSKLGEVEKF